VLARLRPERCARWCSSRRSPGASATGARPTTRRPTRCSPSWPGTWIGAGRRGWSRSTGGRGTGWGWCRRSFGPSSIGRQPGPVGEGRRALDAEICRDPKGVAEVVIGDGPWAAPGRRSRRRGGAGSMKVTEVEAANAGRPARSAARRRGHHRMATMFPQAQTSRPSGGTSSQSRRDERPSDAWDGRRLRRHLRRERPRLQARGLPQAIAGSTPSGTADAAVGGGGDPTNDKTSTSRGAARRGTAGATASRGAVIVGGQLITPRQLEAVQHACGRSGPQGPAAPPRRSARRSSVTCATISAACAVRRRDGERARADIRPASRTASTSWGRAAPWTLPASSLIAIQASLRGLRQASARWRSRAALGDALHAMALFCQLSRFAHRADPL
jgi:hypothetical protein